MAPFFSIIIPTFNAAHTLERCLTSLSNQILTNFEVIVQDGLSTDDTEKIAHSFKSKIDLNYYSESDTGIYDGMNKAIAKAAGKYLFFLGADDELHDNLVLSDIFDFLSKSQLDIIWGNCEIKETQTIKKQNFQLHELYKYHLNHQSIFYHRDLFVQYGLYETGYSIYADQVLSKKLLLEKKATYSYVDRTISIYSQEGFSSKMNDHLYASQIYDFNFSLFPSIKKDLILKETNYTLVRYILQMNLEGSFAKSFKAVTNLWFANKKPLFLRTIISSFLKGFIYNVLKV